MFTIVKKLQGIKLKALWELRCGDLQQIHIWLKAGLTRFIFVKNSSSQNKPMISFISPSPRRPSILTQVLSVVWSHWAQWRPPLLGLECFLPLFSLRQSAPWTRLCCCEKEADCYWCDALGEAFNMICICTVLPYTQENTSSRQRHSSYRLLWSSSTCTGPAVPAAAVTLLSQLCARLRARLGGAQGAK